MLITLRFFKRSAAGGASSLLQVSDFTAGAGTQTLDFSLTYMAAT